MKNVTIYAMPGFLGLPSDWEMLSAGELQVKKVVLLSLQDYLASSQNGLNHWAKSFNASIRAQACQEKRLLLGYSLGGRLAMHALLQDSSLWSGAVLISSHSGLKNELDKQKRLSNDHIWAERFENDSWESLMQAWNAQSIFAGSPLFFQRNEKDYDRKILASHLRNFSLGQQRDLSLSLLQLTLPRLWMVGERDCAYTDLMQAPMHSENFQRVVMTEAGHRAPWEKPESFLGCLKKFLNFF